MGCRRRATRRRAGAARRTAFAAQAQTYPAKPIHLIVPFAPGGGTDITARYVAQRLSERLGKPVLVENKPSAGGMIGAESGIKAAPDGYTLVMISSSYSVNPALYKLSYDPIADISPIVQVSEGPELVLVNPGLPANSLTELIALAKQKPGTISFASAGQGSITHMAAEFLCTTAGIKMLHVPYKGTGPALTDSIAGQTQVFVTSPSGALPHVRAGRLRVLAVTTATRSASLPEVPTVAESGFPGFEVVNWYGLIGPKGLPSATVERLRPSAGRS